MCIFLHILSCMESSFKYERVWRKVLRIVVADCFLQLCGATESRSPAVRSPSRLFSGVMWQQGAVPGFMCDWRVISVSNERAAQL